MSGRRVAMCVVTSEDRAGEVRHAVEAVAGDDADFFAVVAEDERFDALTDALMPPTVPSPAFVEQARRNVAERVSFLERYAVLTAEQVAETVGSHATNRRALAARWRAERKVFAVRVSPNTFVYPAFQFDLDAGVPRAVIAEVLAALPAGLRDGGWQLAFWWDTPTDFLGWVRPVELLEKDPEAVVAAARDEAREWAEANPSPMR